MTSPGAAIFFYVVQYDWVRFDANKLAEIRAKQLFRIGVPGESKESAF